MESKEALRSIVRSSGMSMRSISVAIGKTPNYLASTTKNDSSPLADTMAEIADVCGYDLKLEKRDGTETIIIDPPQRE